MRRTLDVLDVLDILDILDILKRNIRHYRHRGCPGAALNIISNIGMCLIAVLIGRRLGAVCS